MDTYRISFILNETRFDRWACMTQDEASQIQCAIEKDYKKAFPYQSGDIQVFAPLDSPDSAYGLIDCIVSAQAMDEADRKEQKVVLLERQANTLDRHALEGETRDMLFEFTWDNGGGDDNNFSWVFSYSVNDIQKVNAFCDDLGQWLETHGHGYAPAYRENSDQPETLEKHEALEEIIDAFADHDIDMPAVSALHNTFLDEYRLKRDTPLVARKKSRASL